MITHPEKVLFPDDGITKGELAAYYEAVAPFMLPHISGPARDDGALSRGHRRRRASCRRTSRRASRTGWSASRRAEEGRRPVHYPLVQRRAVAALARQPELHHAARLDLARAQSWTSPTSASSILDPSRRRPDAAARGGARGARPARRSSGCRAWSRRPARRASTSSSRSTARPTSTRCARFAHGAGRGAGQAPPGHPDPGVHQGRPRAAASSSTPAATDSAPPSRRSTPCAEAGRARVRAVHAGRRSSGARSRRRRSRCARWRRLADVGELWADLLRRRRSLVPAIRRLEKLMPAAARDSAPARYRGRGTS